MLFVVVVALLARSARFNLFQSRIKNALTLFVRSVGTQSNF